jgi:hypothetical protein
MQNEFETRNLTGRNFDSNLRISSALWSSTIICLYRNQYFMQWLPKKKKLRSRGVLWRSFTEYRAYCYLGCLPAL